MVETSLANLFKFGGTEIIGSLNRVINSCIPAVLPPPSEHIAIIDNPEELKCGADCSQKSGAMGIEWVFWLLLIDPESPLINAYSILSNQN